jgi:cyclophilin family peptidyl-prolyl cis-trans isomerase
VTTLHVLGAIAMLILPLAGFAGDAKPTGNPQVRLTTSLGPVELELDAKRAPRSTANFLKYVDNGHYNGTVFHRVIPGFMIQGGGFGPAMAQPPAGAPITNEADNGLKNIAGAIAMARTGDPHSASAQFFINTADNAALDHRDKTPRGWGYAVFGKVTKGMDVVKQIENVPTAPKPPHQNVPTTEVTVLRAERIDATRSAQE